MKIIIKTKNLQLASSLEGFINKKLAKIEKFLPDNKDLLLEIEIERETLHHRKGEVYAAGAIIELPGKKLVAKAKEEDLPKAIAKMEKELEVEIKKYKVKKFELIRREPKKPTKRKDFNE